MKRILTIASLTLFLMAARRVSLADVFTYNNGAFQNLIYSPGGGDCGCKGFLAGVAYLNSPIVPQINNTGQVLYRNVLYSGDGMPLIGPFSVPQGPMNPGSNTSTDAYGLNDLGQIVGTVGGQDPVTGRSYIHSFLYVNGTYTIFDDPGGSPSWGTRASALNNAGQIVGTSTDVFSNPVFFVATNGVFTAVNIPASLNPVMGPVGPSFVNPNAINNKGEIVGAYWAAGGPLGSTAYGFLDNGGVFTAIQFPGAAGTTALGINDSGEIVGTYVDNTGTAHGFLDVGGSFSTIDFPGSPSTVVSGINNAGEIVGTDVSQLPEPTTILLIAIGISAIGIHNIHRRRDTNTSLN